MAHRPSLPYVKRLLAGMIGWALTAPPVWAIAYQGPTQAARTTVVLSVIAAGLFAGLVLYWYSQRTGRAKFKSRKEEKEGLAIERPAGLIPAVFHEVSRLPISPEQCQQVAKSVSDIVDRTVAERLEKAKKDIHEQFAQLLEERHRTEAVLQHKFEETLQEKKQTAKVLESIAEGLVVVNNKGEIVMMNPAAEKLLAIDQEGRVGKPLLEGLRDEQLVSLVSGTNEDREIVVTAKQDSTKRVLRASNAVVTDENGKAVGMVAVLSDVTKQHELEELKSEFVSKVGHELRTPIVAMQHALSILVDGVAGPLSEEQQKFVALSQRNLQRLNAHINDLLDLSKLEAKKLELRLESVALGEVIQSVSESLDAWAKSKALMIIRRVPEDLPRVTCDPMRITQVLTNLVGNAVKFTPRQGRITIEAKRADEDRAVEVSVTDTGVGIVKEDLPKLFSKFQQVGERMASDISGTGLGLVISKEIVEIHHGRIWAESDAPRKEGARFAFVLPIEQPTAQKPAESTAI